MLELPRDMLSYIAPSLMDYAQKQQKPLEWLVNAFLGENGTDEEKQLLLAFYNPNTPIYWTPLLEKLEQKIMSYDATTNNGKEFYIDQWTSVPWCDTDTYLEWYS